MGRKKNGGNIMNTIYTFRTLIIAEQDASLARDIARTLGGSAGEGMWTTGLSPIGALPITHYVSTGYVGGEFAEMCPLATWEWVNDEWVQTDYVPGNAELVASACAQNGLIVTPQQIEELYSRTDMTTQEPFVAFSRLSLMMVVTEAI